MAADDTSRIAGEAEDTRERISATLDELQDRLNPRRIVSEAVDSVQAGGADLLKSGRDLVRGHPVTLAAGGLAIGLALLGTTRLRSARVNFGDDSESYSDYDDSYEDRRSEPASERFALLRGPNTSFGGNPFVGVLVGLAAGALMGALFPETESERRLLGDTGHRLADAAREKVDDLTGQAKSAVQSVVDAAKNELGGHRTT
ncbi:DUF3618 domain-containing protein [Sphingosinicellaceae bacterium]|nr:DUF3618 domain-containing protein [Sphingosinicellaceae bacterium]